MTVDEILLETGKSETNLVEITGGEPFVQTDFVELSNRLRREGYEVLIETSGGFPIPEGLDRSCHVIMDIKPPGSGMSQWMNPDHFRSLTSNDEIKAVCQSREDFDWVVSTLDDWRLPAEIPVTVSPVFDLVDPKELGQWVLESRRRFRIQIQLHKILFDPKGKGGSWPRRPRIILKGSVHVQAKIFGSCRSGQRWNGQCCDRGDCPVGK